MLIQWIIVALIIAAAVAYAASTLLKKRKAFSTKSGCGDNCGCSGAKAK